MRLDFPESQRWFELSIAKKASPEIEIPRFIAISRDITAHKATEKALLDQAGLLERTGEIAKGGESPSRSRRKLSTPSA